MDAVDEVKSRLNIEDVIGEYVQLKRAGRNFKGLSPFNTEKTPSFVVSPDKQIWHDFSSGRGGSVFSFVMEMEGLDFRGALELLARKAGVDLDQYDRKPSNTKLKDTLYEINEQAARFYQVQFSRNQAALQYVLKTRGFTKDTALKFRLGYSPNNGTALLEYLRKQGFAEVNIIKAGLATKRYKDAYDMFRGRLMVPLQDAQGRVVGFTARDLQNSATAPKYINTPATPIYDKSRHVFGLHLAKDTIRKQAFAVLVEGNLDVIASHQAGVTNTVATAGTALTEMQLKTIGRFAGDIRLAFDTDKAGIAATERAIPVAAKADVTLGVITIPEGKDPDELIQRDPTLWQEAIGSHVYAVDWLIERLKSDHDIMSGHGKKQFTDALMPVVSGLKDPVEQEHYLRQIAQMTRVSFDALQEKLNGTAQKKQFKKPKQSFVHDDQLQLEWAKTQDHLLCLALMRPELRDQLELIDEDMFPQESARRLLDYLQAHPDFDGRLSSAPLLHDIADYVKIVALQYEALFQDLDEHEARYEANRLRVRLIGMYVKNKKAAIAEALHTADEATSQKLLARAKALDNLLKTSQENID
jgi:DNA primase